MNLAEKFQRYFDENGVQRKWFADQLNITPQFFYQIINGYQKLPAAHWSLVVHLTRGQISIADILEEAFKNIDIEIIKGDSPEKCEVIVKSIAKK